MKTALVTGANKGIGYEVARQMAALGWRVFLGARNEQTGRAAAQALSKKGASVTFVTIDVSDDASVHASFASLREQADALDVLVNNAGIVLDEGRTFPDLDEPTELLRRTFETNTFGPLRVAAAFLPLLEKSAEPRIINVSSGAGQLTDGADGWAPAYCISKTALNGITAQLACAWPKIAVNSVCPGWVRTDMGGSAAPRSVEHGADTIVWLATEAPHGVTGKFMKDRKEIPW